MQVKCLILVGACRQHVRKGPGHSVATRHAHLKYAQAMWVRSRARRAGRGVAAPAAELHLARPGATPSAFPTHLPADYL